MDGEAPSRVYKGGMDRGEGGQVRILPAGGALGRGGASPQSCRWRSSGGKKMSIPEAGEVFSGECIVDLDRRSSSFTAAGTISRSDGRICSVGYPPGAKLLIIILIILILYYYNTNNTNNCNKQ